MLSDRFKPPAPSERRRAAESDADVLIGAPVTSSCRHFDVGVLERRHLVFPVGVLELQEDRAQRAES
jgi:hypothetical protein